MSELATIPLAAVVIGERARKEAGELGPLIESIRSVGLLHPPVVNEANELISGFRRLKACERMGHAEVTVHRVTNMTELVTRLAAERDENTCRQPFTPEEMVDMARRIEQIEKPKARQRQEAGKGIDGSGGRGKKKNPPPNGREVSCTVETRNIVAAAVGSSRSSLARAKEVVDAARAEPEKYGDVLTKMNKTGKINGAQRELRKRQAGEPTVILNPPAPTPAEPQGPPEGSAFDDRAEVAKHNNETWHAVFNKAVAAFVAAVKKAEGSFAGSLESLGNFSRVAAPILASALALRQGAMAKKVERRCKKCDGAGCAKCQGVGWVPG